MEKHKIDRGYNLQTSYPWTSSLSTEPQLLVEKCCKILCIYAGIVLDSTHFEIKKKMPPFGISIWSETRSTM